MKREEVITAKDSPSHGRSRQFESAIAHCQKEQPNRLLLYFFISGIDISVGDGRLEGLSRRPVGRRSSQEGCGRLYQRPEDRVVPQAKPRNDPDKRADTMSVTGGQVYLYSKRLRAYRKPVFLQTSHL